MCCKSPSLAFAILLLIFVVCVSADDNNRVPNIVKEYISSRRDLKKKNNGGKLRGKTSKNDKRGKKSKAKSKKAAKNNMFNKDDTPQPNNTPSPPPPPSSSGDEIVICDIEDFISVTTYEQKSGCDYTFKVTIGCNAGRTLCTYEEESIGEKAEGKRKSAHNTCTPFNPNNSGMLTYDVEKQQCILGGKKGLELKDKLDPSCNVKYNVQIVMDVKDSSRLFLYFSNNGGMSYYNLEEPRVATKDINKRRRLESACVKDDCTIDEYEKDPFFVFSSEGRDWNINNGWGRSREKPFKSIQKAINEYKNAMDTRKCQIIYVMEGEYKNNRYEDGAKTSINNVVARLDGVSHLKILKDPEAMSTPKIIFNGPGGIIQSGAPISYIEIAHLEIMGPNQDITYDMAMEDRYNRVKNAGSGSNFFRGRGIGIWNGHHINIYNMTVHHCPNSGIRVNRGDYINITDSRVYSNTWWSSGKFCFYHMNPCVQYPHVLTL